MASLPSSPLRSPPNTPPVSKRARLDPDEAFTTLPPSSSTPGHSSHANGNGNSNGTVTLDPPPPASSAPPAPSELRSAIDPDSEDEPDEPTYVKDEEDLSRRDMYLDTVSRIFFHIQSKSDEN
jgi:U4/U6.U5 tri-snRNP-associated protein 2